MSDTKLRLRIDTDDEDPMIFALIEKARNTAEEISGRALVTRTYEMALDAFPAGAIVLPYPPLQAVSSIKYYDNIDGTLQTVDSSNYVVVADVTPGFVMLSDTGTWPSDMRSYSPIRITYTAGYGDDIDVPERYKSLIIALVGLDYEARDETTIGNERSRRNVLAALEQDYGWGLS